jgi:hypothetical protein
MTYWLPCALAAAPMAICKGKKTECIGSFSETVHEKNGGLTQLFALGQSGGRTAVLCSRKISIAGRKNFACIFF